MGRDLREFSCGLFSVHLTTLDNKTFSTFAAWLVKEEEFCLPGRGFQQTLTESDGRNYIRKESGLSEPLVSFCMSTCLV